MHLCSSMQRTRVKGTMVRQSSNPGTEPDFSTMPPMHRCGAKICGAKIWNPPLPEEVFLQSLFSLNSKNAPKVPHNLVTPQGSIRPGKGGAHHVPVAVPPRTKEDTSDFTNAVGSLTMPPLGVDGQGEISYKIDKQGSTSKSNQEAVLPGLPPLEDKLIEEALRLQPGNDDSSDLHFHPWGSKYMRHLQTLSNPLHVDNGQAARDGIKRSSSNTEDNESVSSGSSSPTGSNSGNEQPNTHGKFDADLVGFLEEVDLESDQDECLVGEEAMERILEQEEEVEQISEV